MTDILITSGLIQLTFGVWLGWPLVGFLTGARKVGPFRHMRRVLQGHLDNIFMGFIQLAIAAVHPAIAVGAGVLLIAGSWLNPQFFLLQAMRESSSGLPKAANSLAFLSFAALTIAYPWLVIDWLTR